MKLLVLYFFIFFLSIGFITAQKVVVMEKSVMRHDTLIDSIVGASNQLIIAKIGKLNFDEWVDSILIYDNTPLPDIIYIYELPYSKSRGSHKYKSKRYKRKEEYNRQEEYKRRQESSNWQYELEYHFSIPGLGRYIRSNYAIVNPNGNMVIDDRNILPAKTVSFNYNFIRKDSALLIVKNYLYLEDTTLIRSKFTITSYSGKLTWQFSTSTYQLELDPVTGEILRCSYLRKNYYTYPQPDEKEQDYEAYAPVTGEDGRCYCNRNWAAKANVKIEKQGCDEKNLKQSDFYTWPIKKVCNPSIDRLRKKNRMLPSPLPDGTLIYYPVKSEKIYRGIPNTCKCPQTEAKINTPKGETPISRFPPVDTVRTTNKKKEIVAANYFKKVDSIKRAISIHPNSTPKVVVVKSVILSHIDSIVDASNQLIIDRIGELNFGKWVDSIVVYDSRPGLWCQKSYKLEYYLFIPGFGPHISTNYGHITLNGEIKAEGHRNLPPSYIYYTSALGAPIPYYNFIQKDSALLIVKNYLHLEDTTLIKSKFASILYAGRLAWKFETSADFLELDPVTGQILVCRHDKRIAADSLTALKSNGIVPSPGQKECDYDIYAPVTGKDGRLYRNKCWAAKANVKIVKEGYDKENYKQSDVYTWPIKTVCNPLARTGDPVPSRTLTDGTLIYTAKGKEAFRGTSNTCKCLSVETKIYTPKGEIPVSQLSPGDTVWTTNKKGERIAAPLPFNQ